MRNLDEIISKFKDKDVFKKVATSVNRERLWQLHMDLARFGERPDGGVNRQALSEEDIAARDYIISVAQRYGFQCAVDPIGNLFVRREGTNPELAPVLTGSHLDSQPTGGKFDGTFGVVAGLEALSVLESIGIKTERSIEVVCWTNEEGSRFAPGVTGSSVFVGEMSLSDILPIKDRQGIRLEEALHNTLQAASSLPKKELGFPVAAYIEAHIEQGPILYGAGVPIGIVTGIQGVRWFDVEVVGAEAHSGTTPLTMRKDALKSANRIIAELQAACFDKQDITRFTVGRMMVEPNSINTVPGRVRFSIDLRHPQRGELIRLQERVIETCNSFAVECGVAVTEVLAMEPIQFDSQMTDLLGAVAQNIGLESMPLVSGAFHDARLLSQVCPTAMVFIPCDKGISHSPTEFATSEDIAAGAQVLAVTLTSLAGLA